MNNKQTIFRYFSQLFRANAPLRVVEIGSEKTQPLHNFGPALRPYYLLHLIEKGKGYIERDGNKHFLSEGEAFLIVPDEITVYCSDREDPWEYSWIAFDGESAKALTEHSTDVLYMTYRKSGLLALKELLANPEPDALDCLQTLLQVMNSVKRSLPKREIDSFRAALHYLENNYFKEIDIAALAQEFGFSRSYFSTAFTQKTGESPHRYLIEIRLNKAKEYLTDTDLSVTEIAYSVGFNSLQRFSELFKKRTGYSPLEYRKRFTKTV